jgi:hypothetical protein
MRFEVLHGMDDRSDARGGKPKASFEMRRAAVLSYEEIVARPALLRRVARPLAVMPAPASRVDAQPETASRVDSAPQPPAADLARDPLAYPAAPPRPERAAKPRYEVVVDSEDRQAAPAIDANHVAAQWRQAQTQAQIQTVEPAPSADLARTLQVNEPIEPVEPVAEPRHRGSLHGAAQNPVRSTLSPSQRAALQRPEKRVDRFGRTAYVTYTVDSSGKK